MISGLMGESLLIGLSDKNIKLLKKGKPIRQMTPKGEIVIIYGKTEFTIVNDLKREGLVTESTAKKYEGFEK